MTEAGWLACEDPTAMLEFHQGQASDRKLRLFLCACCRHIWDHLSEPRSRRAVEVSERFADGMADASELRSASRAAHRAWFKLRTVMDQSVLGEPKNPALHDATAPAYFGSIAARAPASTRPRRWAKHSIACAALAIDHIVGRPLKAADGERIAQALLLRDIFGNPFRPVTLAPAWLTSDVLALARGIYDDRAFDRMPILADALQDAGCDNDDILNHCRDTNQVHVRGCWVVDLVLGKS